VSGSSDDGSCSPNPANRFQLEEIGHSQKLGAKTMADIGMLYSWAQTLAGMTYPNDEEKTAETQEVRTLAYYYL